MIIVVDGGPVSTSNGNNMKLNPLYKAFIEAGKEAGYPETKDYNGEQQEGFGPMHMTVGSAACALQPQMLTLSLQKIDLILR